MKNVRWSSCKVPVILVRPQEKLIFFRQILELKSKIKFHENPSSASRVLPCGQTDSHRHDEANSSFSQFCESVEKAMISLHEPKVLVLIMEAAFVLCELRTRS